MGADVSRQGSVANARVNVRGGPTSLFWLAPNPLRSRLAAIPIKVPFHSIIGNRGIDEEADRSDGIVAYRSSHLERAESEKIVPAGHNLVSNPTTVAEIKRILEENIVGLGKSDRCRPANSRGSTGDQDDFSCVHIFLDHSLDQACDSEGGMFWSAFSVAAL